MPTSESLIRTSIVTGGSDSLMSGEVGSPFGGVDESGVVAGDPVEELTRSSDFTGPLVEVGERIALPKLVTSRALHAPQ